MKKTAAILLAAGASSRSTEPKQLFRIAGVALVQRQVARLLESGIARVYVVVGYHHERVVAALEPSERVRVVHNPSPQNGMFSSLCVGLEALGDEARLLIHPVDVPLPSAALLASLLSYGEPLVVPVSGEKKGHPVIVERALAMTLPDGPEQRLDHWLARHRGVTRFVSVEDACIVRNANTDAQLSEYFNSEVS